MPRKRDNGILFIPAEKKIVKEVKEGLYDEKFKVRKAVTKYGTRRREDRAPKN